MPLYEDRRNAENRISVPAEWAAAIKIGAKEVIAAVLAAVKARSGETGRAVTVALDGWYGVDWPAISAALAGAARTAGLRIDLRSTCSLYLPQDKINAYKARYTVTDDPGFGVVNAEGRLADLMDAGKVAAIKGALKSAQAAGTGAATVVFGPGAAIAELNDSYDLRFYFEMTRQPLLWQMWDGQLVPFGMEKPKADYGWKEYYYCDFYLLHRHKEYAFEHMDYFVEAIDFKGLKLMPRKVYDGIMRTLVQYPIKEVKIFQPGPWGAYRYKQLWDVPGLECNAWNELAGPELSVLVDVGREQPLNLPFMNLMQYGEQFVGPYLHKELSGMFPLDVWLDDGYFPHPVPAERASMPIHNHPSTDYVKQHFREPLGRYETYYIAEAYQGANTWMGFKEGADLELWEAKCRESERTGQTIPDWKDFIANHASNVGDLYLIPPGTTHGHGGHQMVLEMDTCPSLAGTEYSFFMYDFCRPSWDDKAKTMTGKPVKMHLNHGFDTDKWVREDWVRKTLRARPEVVKWTSEYGMDRYSSYGPMPFEIERFHFNQRADNNTSMRFLHILTLTVGQRVRIQSKSRPELRAEIELFQSAVVPACFGEYELLNVGGGACTVVQFRWKKG